MQNGVFKKAMDGMIGFRSFLKRLFLFQKHYKSHFFTSEAPIGNIINKKGINNHSLAYEGESFPNTYSKKNAILIL